MFFFSTPQPPQQDRTAQHLKDTRTRQHCHGTTGRHLRQQQHLTTFTMSDLSGGGASTGYSIPADPKLRPNNPLQADFDAEDSGSSIDADERYLVSST